MAKIGMKHVVFAPITAETAGSALTYGNGTVIGHAMKGTVNWDTNDNPLYGDDVIVENDNGANGYTLEIGVTEMLETVEATVLGYTAVGTTDVHYEITDQAAPYGGCGYLMVLKRNNVIKYKAVWFYKVQFSMQTEETQTKKQQIEWGTPVITGRGMGVLTDSSGKAYFRKQKVFDTFSAAMTWLDGLANITTTPATTT